MDLARIGHQRDIDDGEPEGRATLGADKTSEGLRAILDAASDERAR